jgi:hypothetical protein
VPLGTQRDVASGSAALASLAVPAKLPVAVRAGRLVPAAPTSPSSPPAVTATVGEPAALEVLSVRGLGRKAGWAPHMRRRLQVPWHDLK